MRPAPGLSPGIPQSPGHTAQKWLRAALTPEGLP